MEFSTICHLYQLASCIFEERQELGSQWDLQKKECAPACVAMVQPVPQGLTRANMYTAHLRTHLCAGDTVYLVHVAKLPHSEGEVSFDVPDVRQNETLHAAATRHIVSTCLCVLLSNIPTRGR